MATVDRNDSGLDMYLDMAWSQRTFLKWHLLFRNWVEKAYNYISTLSTQHSFIRELFQENRGQCIKYKFHFFLNPNVHKTMLSAVAAVEPHPQQGRCSATAWSSWRCFETQVHGPLGPRSAEPASRSPALGKSSPTFLQGTREPPQASHHRAGCKSGRLTNYPVKSKSFSNPRDY